MSTTFSTTYLRASDLSETEDMVLTIRRFEKTEMAQDERIVRKWVLHFDEIEEGLPLIDTNGRAICQLHSKNMDSWPGKRISIYSAPVKVHGEVVQGIRIRPHIPA